MVKASEAFADVLRHGLPSRRYLRLVARYLLPEEQRVKGDPFVIDISTKALEDVYVVRGEVEDEVYQVGTTIILGPNGRGKTTLFNRTPAWSRMGREGKGQNESESVEKGEANGEGGTVQKGKDLLVKLPLSRVPVAVKEEELMEGTTSLLTPEWLAASIFNTYWEDLILNPTKRTKHLPKLRRDPTWMDQLRRFYHRFPPRHPTVPDEFELMHWLQADAFSGSQETACPPDIQLEILVSFVLSPPSPYRGIYILIDQAEYLSNKAFDRLIQDVEKVYQLSLDNVQIKLFADTAWEPRVRAMNSVEEGRIRVYDLPPWTEKQLRKLLYYRLDTYQGGDPAGEEGEWKENWGQNLPHLTVRAKMRIVDRIIEEALACTETSKFDAPIHALKLTRGLIAACAGDWKEYGYDPEESDLTLDQIEDIIAVYQRGEEQER